MHSKNDVVQIHRWSILAMSSFDVFLHLLAVVAGLGIIVFFPKLIAFLVGEKGGLENKPALNIAQFWDENPLIIPSLRKFLPANRYLVDCIVTVLCLAGSTIATVYFYMFIFSNEFVALGAFCLAVAVFSGGWWNRWFRATYKFQEAKRKQERSNGGQ